MAVPLLQIPSLPVPPADYGYAVILLAAMGGILLVGLGFATREYLRYRNAQDEERKKREAELDAKHDARWKEVEAAKVEARHRLEGAVNTRIDKLESVTEAFFREMEAKDRAMQGRIDDLDKRVFRLEHNASKT